MRAEIPINVGAYMAPCLALLLSRIKLILVATPIIRDFTRLLGSMVSYSGLGSGICKLQSDLLYSTIEFREVTPHTTRAHALQTDFSARSCLVVLISD